MKTTHVLFEDGDHKWVAIARDPSRPHYVIDTNEYLVMSGGEGILCDPGGIEIFPAVFAAITELVDPGIVKALFSSHQDPDIISSIGLWCDFNPQIRCYVSWLWGSFIPHFGGTENTFVQIPDEGMTIELGGRRLEAVPAHYLHSSGNFHLYDPTAKILFSGDVGAALLPPDRTGLFVTDFDEHIAHATGFHRRWMGSNEAKDRWCERVAQLDVELLCPQHGAIYRGADVKRFLDWFHALHVGI